MAYRRSLSVRASLLARRYNPSFSYISHGNEYDHNNQEDSHPSGSKIQSYLAHRRSFGSCVNNNTWQIGGTFHRTGYGLIGTGLDFNRYLWTSVSEPSDNVEYANDVASVAIADAPMEDIASQAPSMSEVVLAAADSAPPVAALQYFIDGVHSFSGLNWWSSIVLSTLLIRGVTVPLLIYQLKASTKRGLMRMYLKELKAQMLARGTESQAEVQKKMEELSKVYRVPRFTPFMGAFVQVPIFISFVLALSNMVEKFPSFKSGGAFWFTDLTTPDNLFIFPILTTLTFLATVEFHMQGKVKNLYRVLAVLMAPLTITASKAILCYWLTNNIFSFCYYSVVRVPGVKKALGIPVIRVASRSTTSTSGHPGSSCPQALEQPSSATRNSSSAVSAAVQQSKPTNQKPSPSSALHRNLNRQAKKTKRKSR